MVTPRTGELARVHGTRPGLPRGRARLPRSEVSAAHRERLLRAVIAAVAEGGYARATVADIVERARVSRSVFYEHFADKRECFLAGNQAGVELLFGHMTRAVRDVGSAPPAIERLRAALRAYLEFIAREPEFARTFLLEVFAAGPEGYDQFVAAQQRFAARTHAWHARARSEHPDWPRVPEAVFGALVGAIHELVIARVRAGRATSVVELLDTAIGLHLTVLTGWPGAPEAG